MEAIVIKIRNGFLFVFGDDSVFCKDLTSVHQELAFVFGKEQSEPEPEPKGVRQFDDED